MPVAATQRPRWPRWSGLGSSTLRMRNARSAARVCLAAGLLVGFAAACSGPADGDAFSAAGGQTLVGLSVKPGGTAILGGLTFQPASQAGPVQIDSVALSGDGMDDQVATVRAVGVYDVPQNKGIIGADDQPATADRLLAGGYESLPVQVDGAGTKGLAVILDGQGGGKWRADWVDINYRIGDQRYSEHLGYAFGLCVTPTPSTECDVGKPEWGK